MTASPTVAFSDAVRTWARIGLLSFGGPAGQIAVMHRILVEERRWISEQRFLHALNFCMLLPGPEAQQLATYAGWLLHGTRGGLVAGTLFVLPGFLAMMLLGILYVTSGQNVVLAGALLGLKAAVLALVVEAVLRIGRRALHGRATRTAALLAFIAIFLLGAPFPLIVAAAGLWGYFRARAGRDVLAGTEEGDAAPETEQSEAVPMHAAQSGRRAFALLAIWLPLWFVPIGAGALIWGPEHVFTEVAVFFSKMAVVTFGGAYAVLAYVAQQAVEHYAWLTPVQMLDGLGLAESTPGPLILVAQFVGFLAAAQAPGIEHPLLAGVLAACITVWVTFVPCFLWIFLGAPHVERLRRNRALSGALAAITAAVVGVIVNLALWFALHALFAQVTPRVLGNLVTLDVPTLSSVRWPMLLLMLFALIATFAFRWGTIRMLTVSAALGVALALFAS